MTPVEYPPPLKELVGALKRLPGVGPRSAERIALYLIQAGGRETAARLQQSLRRATEEVRLCEQCGFFSTAALCGICSDPQRDRFVICVVERATDILPLERTGIFRGHYHALGGRLSPLEGVRPEDLRIQELMDRINSAMPTEIVLALSADVEGEATAHYLAEQLRPTNVRITRIAQGLPAGLGLDSADSLTLNRALQGRIAMS